MGQLAVQRGGQVVCDAARGNGKEFAPEAAGGHVQRQVQEAVREQQPHAGEVPLQGAAQPSAQRDAVGEGKVEERRGVIDAPAAHRHDDHGQRVQPVGRAQPAGVDGARRPWRGRCVVNCGLGQHGGLRGLLSLEPFFPGPDTEVLTQS
ncbi:hypothetical protein D3C86_1626660 [compost metagenome]